jgi:uncharacterized protein YqgC (DUF456 family)
MPGVRLLKLPSHSCKYFVGNLFVRYIDQCKFQPPVTAESRGRTERAVSRSERELVLETLLYAIGATLIVAGLVGAVVPALPGIPLIFGGIWLIARVDQYRHLGLWWLVGIALVGAVGLTIDLVAGALGATRVGASRRAVWGALLGTVIGPFFGLPGLLLGPFFGAVLGELAAGNSVLRSAHVGVGTWIGLIFGTLIKLVASLTMVALFAAGWWWNRP